MESKRSWEKNYAKKCQGCGAAIKWVKMLTGGIMPVDAKIKKIVRVNSAGYGEVIGGYTSHFASCPKADQFRPKDKK